MGRRRWGAATDTGDPLSLFQVLLNEWSCPIVGKYEATPLMASPSWLPASCFLAIETSVAATVRPTAPSCAAAAVFVEVLVRRRGPSVCLPSFAFSPNVSEQPSERGGAEGTPQTCRSHPPFGQSLISPAGSCLHAPPTLLSSHVLRNHAGVTILLPLKTQGGQIRL